MAAITLGYSPCPNDTFIFDAIANQKIDLEGLTFEHILADVQALNTMALAGKLAATKLSYYAYAQAQNRYILLNAGSALGQACGPLVVALPTFSPANIDKARIAIPGANTTANFLFSLKYPNAKNKIETIFSDIEAAVVEGRADVGLIIHENRFTYAEKGLVELADLGEYWEFSTGYPIPLGGIAVRRDLDPDLQQKIDRIIRRSVEYAFAHREETLPYVRQHAQTMSEEVMLQHIKLYVNKYSIDLGNTGKEAIRFMFNKAKNLGLIPQVASQLFVGG
jgi:1,4-dihydroxy-6-naphthoate synthase